MEYKRWHTVLLILLIPVLLLSGLFAHFNSSVKPSGREKELSLIDQLISSLKADTLTPEQNFTVAYQVLKRSIEISYTEGKAESYLRMGKYFSEKHKYASAVRFLLASGQLFGLLKDTMGMMRVDGSMFSVEIYLKDYKNAMASCRHGLDLARQKNDTVITGIFLERMAGIFYGQQDTLTALHYYKESLKYFDKKKDPKRILEVYISIGGIYLDKKKYNDVIRMYDTLSLMADSIDPSIAGSMYTRMSHAYDQQNQFQNALRYNRKALQIRKKWNLIDAQTSSFINLAGDFLKMNRPDSGMYYMDIGIQEAIKHNQLLYMKNAYGVLYKYYLKKGDMRKALQNFRHFVTTNDSILQEMLNIDINVIRTGQNIRVLKEGIKSLENQNLLQKSLIRNQKIFNFLLMAIVLAVLIAVGLVIRINLSRHGSKRKIRNLNIKLQHEAAERKLIKKKTIEKEEHYRFIAEHSLDLIARIDKNYNFVYASPAAADIFGYSPQELLGGNLFDLVFSGYVDVVRDQLNNIVTMTRPDSVAFLARKKGNEPVWVESTINPVFDPKTGIFREFVSVTRNIQELKKREMGIVEGTKQKENLLREIHHRVKNNFAILVSLISMQKMQTQNEEIRQSLTDLQLRIRTMALVHEMLYRSEDFEKISFPDYVRSVTSVVTSAYGRMNVHLDFDLDPFVINIETAIPLGLMLNELLSNSYRHAFTVDSGGTITVSFKKDKEPNYYAFSVSDTGMGLPDGFSIEEVKSMGLQIVNILVKQIEAQLIIKQDNGTTFTLIFNAES